MKAIIMAAGKGLRLSKIAVTHSKHLIRVNGKSVLKRVIEALPMGITEIIIIVKFMGDKIINEIGDSHNGRPIIFLDQLEDMSGTMGCVITAKDYIDSDFLVVSGDNLYSATDIFRCMSQKNSVLVLKTRRLSQLAMYPDAKGTILSAFFNWETEEDVFINTGCYCLSKDFMEAEPIMNPKNNEYGIPETILKFYKNKSIPLTPIITDYWFPVGTERELRIACDHVY